MGEEPSRAPAPCQSQGDPCDVSLLLEQVLREIQELRAHGSTVNRMDVVCRELRDFREEVRVSLAEVAEALQRGGGAQRVKLASDDPGKGASGSARLQVPQTMQMLRSSSSSEMNAQVERASGPPSAVDATPRGPPTGHRPGAARPRSGWASPDVLSEPRSSSAYGAGNARHFGVRAFQKALQKQLLRATRTESQANMDAMAPQAGPQELRTSQVSQHEASAAALRIGVSQGTFGVSDPSEQRPGDVLPADREAPAAAVKPSTEQAMQAVVPRPSPKNSAKVQNSSPAEGPLDAQAMRDPLSDSENDNPASVKDMVQVASPAQQPADEGSREPRVGLRARVAWNDKVEAVAGEPVVRVGSAPCTTGLARQGTGQFGKGSLDKIRRRVEEFIVRNHGSTSPAVDELLESTTSRQAVHSRALEALAVALRPVALGALKVGGVLPWSPTRFWPSLLFQWAVLLLHTSIFGFLVFQTQQDLRAGQPMPFYAGDLVLAGGCVAGLVAVGAGAGSGQFRQSLAKLEEFNKQQDFTSTVEVANAWDGLLTLVVWLAFLSDRLSSMNFISPRGLVGLSWTEAVRHGSTILSSIQASILVLAILRMTRNMESLVDGFCTKFCRGMSYVTAVADWNNVQASLRMASSAVEWCFAILQSILVLLALAMAIDFRALYGAEWALTASGLLILGMSQILLRAAAVTDSCIRISQLVNATTLNETPMDQERMYLVDYITASAAGFYVFNVRLGAGVAIKVLHYTGLLAFTIARLVLPASSQP